MEIKDRIRPAASLLRPAADRPNAFWRPRWRRGSCIVDTDISTTNARHLRRFLPARDATGAILKETLKRRAMSDANALLMNFISEIA